MGGDTNHKTKPWHAFGHFSSSLIVVLIVVSFLASLTKACSPIPSWFDMITPFLPQLYLPTL
jgi:uncharacterized membrane protein YhdT